jgi:hypothetical protein
VAGGPAAAALVLRVPFALGTGDAANILFDDFRLAQTAPTAPVDLDALTLTSRSGSTITLAEHLDTSYTEGLLVVQNGSIVYERYCNGLDADTRHMLASVTKSVTASLLGIEIARGTLTRDALIGDIAPEFAGTSVADATIGQVIDMTAGTDFDETHDLLADPTEEAAVLRFMRQSGSVPLDGAEPIGTLASFREYGRAYPHGERFEYFGKHDGRMGHRSVAVHSDRSWRTPEIGAVRESIWPSHSSRCRSQAAASHSSSLFPCPRSEALCCSPAKPRCSVGTRMRPCPSHSQSVA